eukprot:1127781-Rhodomonas_salina.1
MHRHSSFPNIPAYAWAHSSLANHPQGAKNGGNLVRFLAIAHVAQDAVVLPPEFICEIEGQNPNCHGNLGLSGRPSQARAS